MTTPISYKDITIKQYQMLQLLIVEKDWTKIIGYFQNKTDDQIESYSLKYYKYLVKRLSFLLTPPEAQIKIHKYANGLVKRVSYTPNHKSLILFKGKLYKAPTDVSAINTGQYRSIKGLLSELKDIDCMHTLCAILYEPVFKSDISFGDKEELFKDVSVQKAYNTLFFCLEVLQNWNLNTQDYLEAVKMMDSGELEKILQRLSLNNTGDGTLL